MRSLAPAFLTLVAIASGQESRRARELRGPAGLVLEQVDEFVCGAVTVHDLAWLPDGRLAVAVSTCPTDDRTYMQRTAVVWDVDRRVTLHCLDLGTTDREMAVELTTDPKGRFLATRDASSTFWDLATGERVTGSAAGGQPTATAFSPDGEWLALAESPPRTVPTIRVARLRDWKDVKSLPIPRDPPVTALAFTADGSRLVAGDAQGFVGTYDVATWKLASTEPGDGAVEALAFGPEGRQLVAREQRDISWNGLRLAGTAGRARVAWSPALDRVAVDGGSKEDRIVRVWTDPAKPPETLRLDAAIDAFALRGDGRLAIASAGRVRITGGSEPVELPAGQGLTFSVCFTPDGRFLALHCDGRVQVRDLAARTLHVGPVASRVGPGARGSELLLVTGDVVLWHAQHHQFLRRLCEGTPRYASIAPDGRRILIVGGERSTGRLLDLTVTPAKSTALDGQIVSNDWSPDGRTLALSLLDNHVRLVDERGTRIADAETFGRPGRPRFSPDGTSLLIVQSLPPADARAPDSPEYVQLVDGRTLATRDHARGEATRIEHLTAEHAVSFCRGCNGLTLWRLAPLGVVDQVAFPGLRMAAADVRGGRVAVVMATGVSVWKVSALPPASRPGSDR